MFIVKLFSYKNREIVLKLTQKRKTTKLFINKDFSARMSRISCVIWWDLNFATDPMHPHQVGVDMELNYPKTMDNDCEYEPDHTTPWAGDTAQTPGADHADPVSVHPQGMQCGCPG